MTDIVLGLIPQYGLYIVFAVVLIACIGIPLPSSVLVLTSGGLAAAGDLEIWQVVLSTLAAFTLGDQLAFNAARYFGPNLLTRLRSSHRLAPLVHKSETMLNKHGTLAVLLSRTVFSPTGPFVGYVSGAHKMGWLSFSVAALTGAMIWTLSYAMIGYLFAGNLPQISNLVASMLVVGVAFICTMAFSIWLLRAWHRFEG